MAPCRDLVAAGRHPAGYATKDGVGLLYAGTGLREALTVLPGKRAWQVAPDRAGGCTERAVTPRLVTVEPAPPRGSC